ncbi:Alpha/Beta hydrolase protein, partial [Stachybotrys elegans]
LAYWTFGSPSNPAVLIPSSFRSVLATTTPFLYSSAGGGAAPPFPPDKFFIVVTSLLGAGESSSPSNTPAPWSGPNFPRVTFEDNVVLQHALLTEKLGVRRLFAEVGFSLGGKQTYHMLSRFPGFVDNAVVIAASARTSPHNWSFIEGPRLALVTAFDFHGGNYTEYPAHGIKAFWRAYSTWALSQEWFRARAWERLSYKTLLGYLGDVWTRDMDANDILVLLSTWQKGDISVYHPEDGGDLAKALHRIDARVLVMPSRTDQYFPPADSELEVEHLNKGELRVIDSIWGHLAGG